MNRKKKVWLILAAVLVVLGGVIFAVVMTSLGWDFTALSGGTESGSIAVTEGFDHIVIDGDIGDVCFLLAEDGASRVEYTMAEGDVATATVSNGVLSVNVREGRPWYHNFFNFVRKKTTIYLSEAAYAALTADLGTGDLTIGNGLTFDSVDIDISTGDIAVEGAILGSLCVETSTGDVRLSSVLCRGALSINVTTGRIEMDKVTCASLSTKGGTGDLCVADSTVMGDLIVERTTGDITLTRLVAARIEVEASTGDVTFASADADTITVTTTTGDVEGSLSSGKIFIPKSSTGKIRVPETTGGGICRITTSTGDIDLTVE